MEVAVGSEQLAVEEKLLVGSGWNNKSAGPVMSDIYCKLKTANCKLKNRYNNCSVTITMSR